MNIRMSIDWADVRSSYNVNRMPREAKVRRRAKKTLLKIQWRLFDEAVSQLRDALAGVPANELNSLIDEAVAGVRRRQHGERKSAF